MVAGCRVASVYMFNGFIAFAVIMGRFVPVSVAGINTELILVKEESSGSCHHDRTVY